MTTPWCILAHGDDTTLGTPNGRVWRTGGNGAGSAQAPKN